jgi:RNase H-fold protein (predicted Holliday junction resolvase)
MCFLQVCLVSNQIWAQDNTIQQIQIAERLTRLEEGLKAIVLEMRTRFAEMNKRMDERFAEMNKRMDERFAAMNKIMDERFESMNKIMDERFESMNKRIDERFAAMNKQMDDRFAAMNKRMDDHFASTDIQFNFLQNYSIALMTSFIALIGFLVWDRKTSIDKAAEKFESALKKYHMFDHIQNDRIAAASPEKLKTQNNVTPENQETVLSVMQKQLHYIVEMMKQIPEMRQKMESDNFQVGLSPHAA